MRTILLLISCSPPENLTLSERILQIADALPLTKDSAATFLTSLFTSSDSLQVSSDGDFKHFTGKSFTLIMYDTDSSITHVDIWPSEGSCLQVPLQELGAKMDSAWQDYNIMPLAKEPPPATMAWKKDARHRKKQVIVMGPAIFFDLSRDSLIDRIRITIPGLH